MVVGAEIGILVTNDGGKENHLVEEEHVVWNDDCEKEANGKRDSWNITCLEKKPF